VADEVRGLGRGGDDLHPIAGPGATIVLATARERGEREQDDEETGEHGGGSY
jgi:hypothetical protein